MENDKGLNVDLYIPRKWCVGVVGSRSAQAAVRAGRPWRDALVPRVLYGAK